MCGEKVGDLLYKMGIKDRNGQRDRIKNSWERLAQTRGAPEVAEEEA